MNDRPEASTLSGAVPSGAAFGSAPGPKPLMSRRQALGRVSKGAIAAGVVAWVTPEILIATPTAAAADALSPPPTSTGGSSTPTAAVTATPATSSPSSGSLAFTGLDALRGAEIGTGLVAGGWILKRWASRNPKPASASRGEGLAEDHVVE